MIRKFPHLFQYDQMDCGPTCLAMMGEFYGYKIDRDFLRLNCSIGKDGVSLMGISKTAEKLGFKTTAGLVSFDFLVEKSFLPCIVHWNQCHFVIVYKVKKSRVGLTVYVSDPGKGLLTYTKEEFLENWASTESDGDLEGIVLLLEPSKPLCATEKTVNRPKRNFHFLLCRFKKYRNFYIQIVLGVLLGSALQLATPFLTQSIVDVGIGSRDIGFIWLVLFGQVMLLFSRTVIDFIRSKILLHISTRINISLISDFFIKLMKLPMRFFDTKMVGDLFQRIEDHKRIEQFLTSSSLSLLFSVFTFIVFGVVLVFYDISIFFVFIVGTVLYGMWISIFLKKRRVIDYKYFAKAGVNNNVTYQLISGMQEIKLQGCEQRKRWEWEDVQVELFNIKMKSLNLTQIQQAGSIAINESKNILITVLSASAVIQGEMTLGMMLAVQYIIGQLNTPVDQLIQFVYSWQDVNISLNRMNEIHSEKDEEDVNLNNITVNDTDDLTITDMCFKYDLYSPSWVLNNVSLTIPKNKVTAIVGSSGSGKTTLLKLILGFYEPNKGSINVGNHSLSRFSQSYWRSQCGVVMQEGFLFSDSIAHNIAISDDTPDLEQIRYAARVANISDYIENLPLMYNTLIGQDGQGLSQGQRQRILLARIIYKNPKYVFLDEATNSLDTKNERIITDNLSKFYIGKTVVVVAHRLSTVCNADQIVVLDTGRVAEIGTHHELLMKKGKYFALIKNQLELGS